MLCEQRITELSPEHSLPVLPEHLGTPSTLSLQLHRARQHIERLEQEHTPTFGGEHLQQEKAELEAQLRSEVLHSEEQRALIESLKQALETRVGKVAENASVLAALAQAQADADQSKLEAAKLQATLTAALASHEQTLEKLQQEEMRQTQALQQKIHSVIQDKQMLDQDRNSLLAQLQDQESEIDTLKAEIAGLRSVQTQLKDSEVLTAQLTQQRERLLAETSQHQTQVSQRTADLELTQSRLSQVTQDFSSLQNQARMLKDSLTAAQQQIETLLVDKRNTNAVLEQTREELATVQAERSFFQNSFNTAKQELGQREAAEFKCRAEINELKKALETQWAGSEATTRSAKSREAELKNRINELEGSRTQVETLLDREKEAHTQTQIEAKERLTRLQTDHREEVQDLERAQARALRDVNEQLQSLEQEVALLGERLVDREKSLQAAINETESSRSRVKDLEKQLQQTEETRAVALRELEESRSQLAAAKAKVAQCQTRSDELEETVAEIAADHERCKQESAATTQQLSLANNQLKSQLDALQVDLESLREDVLQTNEALTASQAKERSATERALELQQEVRTATSTLRSEVALLQAQLSLGSSDSRSLLELVACLPVVSEAQRSRLTADQRALQNLQGQLSEAVAARDKATRDFVALESTCNRSKDEVLTSEVRVLREQLANQQLLHMRSLRKRKDKLEVSEAQRKAAREEADSLLVRLRTLAENYEDLNRVSALLEASVQQLETRAARKDTQRRRLERLLSFALAALPSSEARRLLSEGAELCSQLSSLETEKEEAAARIAELDSEIGLETQRLLVTERSSHLKLESECDVLEKRLSDLEQALIQAKAPTFQAQRTATTPPQREQHSLTRYDPRISPFLSSTIEVRLSQTSPSTAR